MGVERFSALKRYTVGLIPTASLPTAQQARFYY